VFVPGRKWRRFREFRNTDTDTEKNSRWRHFETLIIVIIDTKETCRTPVDLTSVCVF